MKNAGTGWIAAIAAFTLTQVLLNLYQDMWTMSWTGEGASQFHSNAQFLEVFPFFSIGMLAMESLIFFGSATANVNVSRRIHRKVIRSLVVMTPSWFFDFTPPGRSITRLCADMAIVDNGILYHFGRCATDLLVPIFLSYRLSKLSSTSWIIIAAGFCYTSFGVLPRQQHACRELTRSKLRTFGTTIGMLADASAPAVATIRSFRQVSVHIARMDTSLSLGGATTYQRHATNSWGHLRLSLLSPIFLLVAVVAPGALWALSVLQRMGVVEEPAVATPAVLGLVVGSCMKLPQALSKLLVDITEVERAMCSIERLKDLSPPRVQGIHPLEPTVSDADFLPSPDADDAVKIDVVEDPLSEGWRRQGLALVDVSVGHSRAIVDETGTAAAEPLPPVMSGIVAAATRGQVVGIVGRSGSGKSTLLSAISGSSSLVSGCLTVDGVRVDSLTREERAAIIGYLPHEILSVRGWSVRDILDPAGVYTDMDVREAVYACALEKSIRELPGGRGLETVLLPSLSSPRRIRASVSSHHLEAQPQILLSGVQMRMLWLAKLVLERERYKVLLLDEPPRDFRRGVRLETILRKKFAHCVVVLVAHDVAGIRECNAVWVVRDGSLDTQRVRCPKEVDSQDALGDLLG
eukprot:Polyplicarium_translucidae@DN1946_c0_g1_i1.p1